MFTGLITHQGRLTERIDDPRGGSAFVIDAPELLSEGVEVKDSICVSGVCLTAVAVTERTFRADVIPETLAVTALADLRVGDVLNLEASLRIGDRLGGHLVYGHVDAAAKITGKRNEGQGYRVTFEIPEVLRELIVHKGYVAIDGVSLTIAAVTTDTFDVALIPETARRTTLGTKGVGDRVSLEADPLARYALAGVAAYARGAR